MTKAHLRDCIDLLAYLAWLYSSQLSSSCTPVIVETRLLDDILYDYGQQLLELHDE